MKDLTLDGDYTVQHTDHVEQNHCSRRLYKCLGIFFSVFSIGEL